ncbi:S9 family peptidase [Shewanella violacea]|uniref:Dipeptidyl peptidase IV, putative n=1 Tax=Shewanella violacea (strain JCM 10179 / CIP 106290 / LMG 19151 / DSS12) TaxID=637905 RepID=D4ZFL7_SHEVD|nr:prolyl oligopeptidase family serine peptidase [Shewanella violacea]BAJ00466.1 dipeptidyl peptidase IV, putative [Shewanella violacea DSS12]
MTGLLRNSGLSMLTIAILSGCSVSDSNSNLQSVTQVNQAVVTPTLATPPQVNEPLTMKQIMADPDWMGILAKGAYWSDDSQSVYFARQAHASPIRDYYNQGLEQDIASQLRLDQLHLADQQHGVTDSAKTRKAYIYQGNLFIKHLASGKISQLTRQNTGVDGVRFLDSGDLAFWQGDQIFRIHQNSGMLDQIANIKMAPEPKGVQEPDTYIAKQQQRLIKYVALQQDKAKKKQAYKQERNKVDPSIASKTWYLGDKEVVSDLSLSPDARYVLLSLIDKEYSWRSEHDIMPNYLGKAGYVDAVPARARVAEDNPPGERLVLLDLDTGTKKDITIEGLTGFDEDVLAKVKSENAKAQGELYKSEETPRKIQLMQDWGWSQSAIQWQGSGHSAAIMLESLDNKDRWIASLNIEKGSLKTEHRLHDNAWVNYTFNQFGWVTGTDSLYYLSEETGYSHLYLKHKGEQAEPLTQGKFVVSSVTLGPKAQFIYYKANKAHPGIDNVYRVNIVTGKDEQLTQWDGQLSYKLSPDGNSLLLNASRRTEPAELFVKTIGGERKQLTHYTSDTFKNYPWQAPEVVAVVSSHGAGDVYARVYLPQGYDKNRAEKYPAVVFNHGAGYLQNAHYGFSGYFREFMFHNLLTQNGYVVMDMDYRGSKGYGRDWRTSIYRNMGHPEVEDLKDGVSWMAANTNVDTAKVGTYGGSYGGFLTFMALFTEPELFQAGAALRPVTDWAHYNAPYTSNILNTPDVDAIAYERSSPIEYAQGLEKPLLIMTGVLDDNVFFQDSVRLVQRLIELEKPMFETAIYPVEPHGFKQPSSWLDEYRRIYKLFEQELK